jgi:hypothetical protein
MRTIRVEKEIYLYIYLNSCLERKKVINKYIIKYLYIYGRKQIISTKYSQKIYNIYKPLIQLYVFLLDLQTRDGNTGLYQTYDNLIYVLLLCRLGMPTLVYSRFTATVFNLFMVLTIIDGISSNDNVHENK